MRLSQARDRFAVSDEKVKRNKIKTRDGLDLAVCALLLDNGGRGDILDGRVGELQILLEGSGVLDLEPDHGSGDDERCSADSPLEKGLVSVILFSDMAGLGG